MLKRVLLVAMVAVSLTLIFGSVSVGAQESQQDLVEPTALGWLYAYRWDIVWDCMEPHCLAVWRSGSCADPHYVGAGGDEATCSSNHGCISSWTWWATSPEGKLGVPKLWIAQDFFERYDVSNYKAWCYIS